MKLIAFATAFAASYAFVKSQTLNLPLSAQTQILPPTLRVVTDLGATWPTALASIYTSLLRKDNLKYQPLDKPGKQVQAHSPHPEHCWDTRTSTEILEMAELDWQDIEDKEDSRKSWGRPFDIFFLAWHTHLLQLHWLGSQIVDCGYTRVQMLSCTRMLLWFDAINSACIPCVRYAQSDLKWMT